MASQHCLDDSMEDFFVPKSLGGKKRPAASDLPSKKRPALVELSDSENVDDSSTSPSGKAAVVNCKDVGVQIAPSAGSYCRSSPGSADLTYRDLIRTVTCSKDLTIQWLMDRGLIARKRLCYECGEDMKLVPVPATKTSDGFIWRCRSKKGKGHDVRLTLRHGSWFVTYGLVVILTYLK